MFEEVKNWFCDCKKNLRSVYARLNKAPDDIHNILQEFLDKNPLWRNKQNVVMHIVFNEQLPICQHCKQEMEYNVGHRRFCSVKCAQNSDEVKRKIEKTNMAKYGAKSPTMSKNIQNEIKKRNIDKYGVDWPIKLKDIQEKRISTCEERYGGAPVCSDKVKEKMKQTNLEKYGVEWAVQNSDVCEKAKLTKLQRYGTAFTGNCEKTTKALLLRSLKIHKKCWIKNGIEPLFLPEEWEGRKTQYPWKTI